MEDFNLHLTGDTHALSVAHNLIAAGLDARLMQERNHSDRVWQTFGLPRLDIDPYQIFWRRIVDMNDRALRNIIIGLGDSGDGYPRESGFDITPASELMAILALSKDLKDMRQRIGRCIVALNKSKKPVTAEDLGVAGAAAALMKDTILPNLMQTMEGQLAFVHAGPFANIAHGNNSVLADLIALKLGDYVVTESGFGADMGMEKFFHIKCRISGKMPQAVVLVATARALKMHGGGPTVISGKPLPPEYSRENLSLLEAGCENMGKCISIVRKFGVPAVVAINQFPSDTDKELSLAQRKAMEFGAFAAVFCEHYTRGGEGAIDLAQAVVKACQEKSNPHLLYDLDMPVKQKIETIATQLYGASTVQYEEKAEKQIALWEKLGFGNLPVCMAKTQFSFSHDPSLKGVPKDFIFPIREVKVSAGAGFLYPICGDIQLMPGLPSLPSFMHIDIDEAGNILGLA
jgi:formyltetrahydrofolate synthetase